MDIQTHPPSRDERRLRGLGATAFVLSLACAVALWSRGHFVGSTPGPRVHTRPALPDGAGVEGWAGTLELGSDGPDGDGAKAGGVSRALHARLLPLHADPDRQVFDGRALQRRLELGPGAPWRLVVAYLRAGSGSAPSIPLSGWSVVDAEGLALTPIVDGARAEAGLEQGAFDPLRSLLAVPDRLDPGHEVTLILWGRAPGSDPHIEGPLGEAHTWELATRRFDGFPSQPSLARLERGAPAGVGGRAQTPR